MIPNEIRLKSLNTNYNTECLSSWFLFAHWSLNHILIPSTGPILPKP